MRHDDKVRLRTGVEISRLSLGTAAIGGLYTSVSVEDCTETILTAVDNGINFIDTAPHYALPVVAWSLTAARPASSRATGTLNGEQET